MKKQPVGSAAALAISQVVLSSSDSPYWARSVVVRMTLQRIGMPQGHFRHKQPHRDQPATLTTTRAHHSNHELLIMRTRDIVSRLRRIPTKNKKPDLLCVTLLGGRNGYTYSLSRNSDHAATFPNGTMCSPNGT
ncbi:hypothetical protein K402DRAFT_65829 [Aulographum hederae CBS 113979]|uniref:Uncharacterized protein n=1 Tax=Aulographum hederae CBS 113979 TaxID=1176131 RepID=A0A6G1H0Q7_9PEZI|nr:hypothetical protein K402DRAFT_65829 [Aulographum hederae CBS 113979]